MNFFEAQQSKKETFSLNNQHFVYKNGVWVDTDLLHDEDRKYYDDLYQQEKGHAWFDGLDRSNILKRCLERVSLSYRRERFFKKHLVIPRGGRESVRILDIACGAGRDYLTNRGWVVGLDVAESPLQYAKKRYDMVVQTNASTLPFPDNTFDYILSSDFFGHIPNDEKKDRILQEMLRVLKPGGKAIHIIETDSTNRWFKFAHTHPDLFKKYFIDEIGGHIGLELPSACVSRWKRNGFEVEVVKKIWGTIWPIQDYATLFGNEYKIHSKKIRWVVYISRFFGTNKYVRAVVNICLNPLNSFVESFSGLDNGQGLMIVVVKK